MWQVLLVTAKVDKLKDIFEHGMSNLLCCVGLRLGVPKALWGPWHIRRSCRLHAEQSVCVTLPCLCGPRT